MATQTDLHISLFSPQEVEFMAEDELVEIVPNMNMEPLNFIAGGIWSVRSSDSDTSASVACSGSEAERQMHFQFQATTVVVCWHYNLFGYVEIARLLFDYARDDIPDMYMVKFHLVLLFW
ncbi:DNA replication complex GINS protein PSF2 [Raphanus sativus]|nr:DNA replication complex GINS protein PSF2 [Raphanus sativus]